jgi:NAD(P)-dependent dehydrogenase (short-subunit alcohol dehydrogenase family)
VEPLKALAASLSSASGRHITSIVADLNNETDLAKVETKLKDDPSITMLVNNAGFASVAPLLEADIRKIQDNRQWAQNLSKALAPMALPGGYPNMLGPDDSEQIHFAYGSNAERLMVAKKRFDPGRRFLLGNTPRRPVDGLEASHLAQKDFCNRVQVIRTKFEAWITSII